MKNRRFVLAALGLLNAVLLLLLLAQAAPLPTAMAQPGRGAGGYVCVTAKITKQTFEALHMIDLGTRQLHTFVPDMQAQGKLHESVAPRDLEKDFGK